MLNASIPFQLGMAGALNITLSLKTDFVSANCADLDEMLHIPLVVSSLKRVECIIKL